MPEPRAGEVLVRVAAAGVNRPDIMQRMGKYPPPPGASDIPGLEIAGEIVAGTEPRGSTPATASARWSPAAATRSTAPSRPSSACRIPPACRWTQAAAIPETFFTVWTNLFERGRLQSGERVLVHGGTSGIGTTAIQLARAFGATVFATAGSHEQCDRVRRARRAARDQLQDRGLRRGRHGRHGAATAWT